MGLFSSWERGRPVKKHTHTHTQLGKFPLSTFYISSSLLYMAAFGLAHAQVSLSRSTAREMTRFLHRLNECPFGNIQVLVAASRGTRFLQVVFIRRPRLQHYSINQHCIEPCPSPGETIRTCRTAKSSTRIDPSTSKSLWRHAISARLNVHTSRSLAR